MEYIAPAPKGAALLDERMPGWANQIDLETFRIGGVWECVLGQLFANYSEGLRELFGTEADTNPSSPDHPAYTHGFDRLAFEPGPTWANLQEEWEALIRERKTA